MDLLNREDELLNTLEIGKWSDRYPVVMMAGGRVKGERLVIRVRELPTCYDVHVGVRLKLRCRPRDKLVARVSLHRGERLTDYHRAAVGRFGEVLEPHSYCAPDWRGLGLVRGVYAWVLDAGITLMAGFEHTPSARGLWTSLGRDYRLDCYDLRGDAMADIAKIGESRELRLILRKLGN